ncbi:MAG: C1 family peptidase, partial [Planctomycetota bacterium]
MPQNQFQIGDRSFVLDARPDRIDHRDRPYRPPLISLPPRWPRLRDIELALPYFRRMVLDQGREGACTGFGLASVINYVLWRDQVLSLPRSERGLLAIDLGQAEIDIVSPYQLYHLARVYDEWEGEDYEGSSCRGAVKGYHKHGACLLELWSQKSAPTGDARQRWQRDAATRPLGAYYRISRRSINDLQAAIYQVGAVYASANVHAGWQVDPSDRDLPMIEYRQGRAVTGAHAFAIIGFESRGLIIQNSWGSDWG